MNGRSRTTAYRKQLVPAILCTAAFFMAANGDAAEYSEADDIPTVTSLVFTERGVALAVVRDWNRTTYFAADRESYSFQEISEQGFQSLTESEHVLDSSYRKTELDINLLPTDDCAKKGYRYDTGDHDMTGRRVLQLPSNTIDVEMFCRSSVSSAISIDGAVWLGTYTAGGHGDYGSEGVVVVPKNGDAVVRLDIGRDIVTKLAVDPWSSDVWVATHSRLFRVANDTAILARYTAYRGFNYDEQRPVVRVTASQERIKNDPLAVLAEWLGASSYRTLSEASKTGVELPGTEPLYEYAMFGNYMSHRPLWPEELAGALEDAQPTFGWRKFACLLAGDTAEQLCTTDLGEWPVVTNSYVTILNHRYPGYEITGPMYGPSGDENLRGNRQSPQNFSEDILVGDFDSDGVRDFAAVLIEQDTTVDPNVDRGPIGFVVVCSGKLSPDRIIEYSCADLTEREPGGFRAELDYLDWAPWADILLDRIPKSGDRRYCPYMLQPNEFNRQTKRGTKKLSITSSFGHCDWFFYHRDETYQGCEYCAD